jgi:hypothetical protein
MAKNKKQLDELKVVPLPPVITRRPLTPEQLEKFHEHIQDVQATGKICREILAAAKQGKLI